MSTLKKRNEVLENTIALRSAYQKLPIEVESANIAKFLPDDLYKTVAKIIGLDENIKEKLALAKRKDFKKLYKGVRYLSRAIQSATAEKEPSEDYDSDSPIVEPPSPRQNSKSPCVNPYYDFLQKTEREQVQWTSKYLLPETELEKGLVKRADDLTNQICADFCNYMHELGGYDSPLFQQDTVKELFQIEFDTHAAKSLKIGPRRLASLPAEFANHKGIPELSRNNMLKRNIKWDIHAEKKFPVLTSFSKQLPKEKQWRPPKNLTKQYWKPQDHPKEIVTMENVWDGITNLQSVHDYCKWIDGHPKSKKPNYLKKRDFFDMKRLEKISHQFQYDEENQLPKIDLKEMLSRKKIREKSPLPEDLKIDYEKQNIDIVKQKADK